MSNDPVPSDMNQIVSYTYDSWGKPISIKDANGNEITDQNNIGIINPYRYRSYRYDYESGLYYLNSRYYVPEWGRFLNADGMVSTGQGLLSHNMYAYCNNNPVNNCDFNGMLSINFIEKLQTIVKLFIQSVQLKNNPTALTWGDNAKSTYANESNMSVTARMLYGEDHNAKEAHLWMLENRRIAGEYGGNTIRELILAKNQFSCMWENRTLNPASQFDRYGEKIAWDACVDMAFLYELKGIESIPKPSDNFNYTWTYTYSESIKKQYPNGTKIGGTWFYSK